MNVGDEIRLSMHGACETRDHRHRAGHIVARVDATTFDVQWEDGERQTLPRSHLVRHKNWARSLRLRKCLPISTGARVRFNEDACQGLPVTHTRRTLTGTVLAVRGAWVDVDFGGGHSESHFVHALEVIRGSATI